MLKRTASMLIVAAMAVLAAEPLAADTVWNTTIAASNPLNWYRFDEASGTALTDYGSGGLNGTFETGVGPSQRVTGEVGTAMHFNGNDDYILLGGSQLGIDNGWTLEAVVRRTSDSSAVSNILLDSTTTDFPATAVSLEQYKQTHQVGITQYHIGDYTFTPAVTTPIGQWVDLVLVGSSSGTDAYINGQYVGHGYHIALPRGAIGCPRGASSLNADLDEMMIYDRALSSTEIAAHYAATPEPNTLVLAATGLIGLLAYAWRRRK